jgi:hypothetical protein
LDTRTLIDSIVRQTTVLIAQLSTAAGIRAPLAHVADQVFLDLARELERQGVRQKVAADMFGVALRSYQKKVQRLAGTAGERDRTLWEAVVAFIAEAERRERGEIERRFRRDDPRDLAAVLHDLVQSGLVYTTGSGAGAVFGMTGALPPQALSGEPPLQGTSDFVWLAVFRHGPTSERELGPLLNLSEADLRGALDVLVGDGRITVEQEAGGEARYRAGRFTVPVGSSEGWEAAVFDHFQALANAVAAKVSTGTLRSRSDDVVGGATLRFDVSPNHPLRSEVLAQLREVRTRLNELWERVEAHNGAHPIPAEEMEHVTFYFGQHAQAAEGPGGHEE